MKIIDVNGQKRDCVSVAPDPKFAGFMKVDYASKTRKDYKHTEWYPIPDFIKNNPTLKHLTKNAPKLAADDLGVVTKATKTTLVDKTKNWKKDAYLGFPIWISRGLGEGQTRSVISNTKSTLNIDKPWEILPNSTSQYVVSHNIHDPKIMGNTLPAFKNLKNKKLTKRQKKYNN